MDSKKWYKSRTIWAGIIVVLIATYNSVSGSLVAGCSIEGGLCVTLPQIPEFVYAILGAFGVYARNTTTTKIG